MLVRGHPLGTAANLEGLCIVHNGPSEVKEADRPQGAVVALIGAIADPTT